MSIVNRAGLRAACLVNSRSKFSRLSLIILVDLLSVVPSWFITGL